MAGFLGVVAFSIFNYRRKSASTKTSVYVIQTRVAAQGLVISVLMVGLGFHMYDTFMKRRSETQPHETALNWHQFHDKEKKAEKKN